MARGSAARGYLLAGLAAALYGTNPVFAAPLYASGMNSLSVVLCRYVCSLPLLAGLVFISREAIHTKLREILLLALLGVIMGLSSWTLYEAYLYMNAGLASALLFIYPVLTALIMIVFFHEPFRWPVGASLLIMMAGLCFLAAPSALGTFNLAGATLVGISAVTFSIYLVLIKVCPGIARVPAAQSLFWQLLAGALLYGAICLAGIPFTAPRLVTQWSLIGCLALFPTLFSLLCTLKAVSSVGPTATAIFGALEPVTAIVLSWLILGEKLTLSEIAGSALIVAATLVVAACPVPGARRRDAK